MKALILLALTASLNAFAGNDGPSAMPPAPGPMPRAYVVAEYHMSCGFMCPDGRYNGVTIESDGTVTRIEGANGQEKRTVLAALSTEATLKLIKEADALPDGKLVDDSAGKPECMDAPSSTYKVTRSTGKDLEIGGRFGCHNYHLKNNAGS
ncbi:MAG: hypothetical protein ACXWSC_03160, partial [Bdellovibrionota bacterium]